MAYRFLTIEEILRIHSDQISKYGGSPGIRSLETLESAIGAPQSGHSSGYFHKDAFEMAAAYLFHLTGNHPFVDGNKRVGSLAAFVFLQINSIDLIAPENEFYDLTLRVANSACTKDEIAEFFRTYATH